MSGIITPRKRKASGDVSRSGGVGKQRGAPTPNPPLIPFPTPPRSRSRRAEYIEPDLDIFASSSSPFTTDKPRQQLPTHLQTLLTLHRAFNVALSLHIATKPPVLPPHPPSATSVKLPNLTNLVALRESIERTGGRRFGIPELQRLAWLWTWDGQDPDKKGANEEDDNPFFVSPTPGQSSKIEISGLDYLIAPTRTLEGSGRRVYTYGIGIELELRPGETRQLLHGGSEGGIGNKGQGGGMGAVGRWNVAGEEREAVVREKLEKWVQLHGGYEAKPRVEFIHGLPTPTNTREDDTTRSTIPPIPLLPLPPLPNSTLLPSANLFSSLGAANANASYHSPQKPTLSPLATTGPAGLADPFVFKENQSQVTPKGKGSAKATLPGSVEERKQAMMDRIKARKSQKNPLPTLGSDIANGPKYSLTKAETQEELARRSTLSRLESVAEAVWMMFSAPTPSSSLSQTPPRARRKAISMHEAAEVIVKSSKTPISMAEAQSSLTLLTELCPFFLQLKTIARSEWLEMPPQVAAVPASPSSGLLGSAFTSGPFGGCTTPGAAGTVGSTGASVSSTAGFSLPKLPPMPDSPTMTPRTPRTPKAHGTPLIPRTPVTPGRAARVAAMELGGMSPGAGGSPGGYGLGLGLGMGMGVGVGSGGAIAGPASPGRVRRVGGLREVRERIRRELGE